MNETPEERLFLAFDLFEFGLDMQQRKLARLHPTKTERELDELLVQWLQSPSTAPRGDCEGRLVSPTHFQS
jgi:Rv0078B-related antitoxin